MKTKKILEENKVLIATINEKEYWAGAKLEEWIWEGENFPEPVSGKFVTFKIIDYLPLYIWKDIKTKWTYQHCLYLFGFPARTIQEGIEEVRKYQSKFVSEGNVNLSEWGELRKTIIKPRNKIIPMENWRKREDELMERIFKQQEEEEKSRKQQNQLKVPGCIEQAETINAKFTEEPIETTDTSVHDQMWCDTTCGFPGFGGQSFTNADVLVVTFNGKYNHVFVDYIYAYSVYNNEEFKNRLAQFRVPGQVECAKVEGKVLTV